MLSSLVCEFPLLQTLLRKMPLSWHILRRGIAIFLSMILCANRLSPLLAAALAAAVLPACGDKNAAVPSPAAVPASASAKPDPDALIAAAARERIEAPAVPLSALAELGRKMFYDKSLSATGKLACSSLNETFCARAGYVESRQNDSVRHTPAIRCMPLKKIFMIIFYFF